MATIYASPTGSNEAPYATIETAATNWTGVNTVFVDGDTVIVDGDMSTGVGGTVIDFGYDESVVIQSLTTKSGKIPGGFEIGGAAKTVSIQGILINNSIGGPGTCSVRGTLDISWCECSKINVVGGSTGTIDNTVFIRPVDASGSDDFGIVLGSLADVSMVHNVFYNNSTNLRDSGMVSKFASSDVISGTISENIFYSAATATPDAITIKDPDTHVIDFVGTIDNNDFYNITGAGTDAITLDPSFLLVSDTVGTGNWRVDNATVRATGAGIEFAPIAVTGVTLDESLIFIGVGETAVQLTATVLPVDATDKSVTWASSDELVCTVVAGLVSPVAKGSAIITVTTTDGSFTDTCGVSVIQHVESVTLDESSIRIHTTDDPVQLTATVLPIDANVMEVVWSSSDEAVATVDQTGLVTQVGVGTATVTATATDGGLFDTCAVDVAIEATSVTLNYSELDITAGGSTVQLVATVLPANTTHKEVTWLSSDPTKATVSATGVVTGVAEGPTLITVTVTDGEVTNTCAVAVNEVVVPQTYFIGTAGSNTAPYNTRAKAATSPITIKNIAEHGDTVYICDDDVIDATAAAETAPWRCAVTIRSALTNTTMPIVKQAGGSGIVYCTMSSDTDIANFDVQGIRFVGSVGGVPGDVFNISVLGATPTSKAIDGAVCSNNEYDYSMCVGAPLRPPVTVNALTMPPPNHAVYVNDGLVIESNLMVYPETTSGSNMPMFYIPIAYMQADANITIEQNTCVCGWPTLRMFMCQANYADESDGWQRWVIEKNLFLAPTVNAATQYLSGFCGSIMNAGSSIRDNVVYGPGMLATNTAYSGSNLPIVDPTIDYFVNMVAIDPELSYNYEPKYYKTWGWQGWRSDVISTVSTAKELVAAARTGVQTMSLRIQQLITLLALGERNIDNETARLAAGEDFKTIWDSFDVLPTTILFNAHQVFAGTEFIDAIETSYSQYAWEYRTWASASDRIFNVGADSGTGTGFNCHFNELTATEDTLAWQATYNTYGSAAKNYHSIVLPQMDCIGMLSPNAASVYTAGICIFGALGTVNAFSCGEEMVGTATYGTLANKFSFIRKLLTGVGYDVANYPDENSFLADAQGNNVTGTARIDRMAAVLDAHDAWLDSFGVATGGVDKNSAKNMQHVTTMLGSQSRGRYIKSATSLVGIVPGMCMATDNNDLLVPVTSHDIARTVKVIAAIESSLGYLPTVGGATVVDMPSTRLEVTALAVSKPLTPGEKVCVMIYGDDVGKLVTIDLASPGTQTVVGQCVRATALGWEIEVISPYREVTGARV